MWKGGIWSIFLWRKTRQPSREYPKTENFTENIRKKKNLIFLNKKNKKNEKNKQTKKQLLIQVRGFQK